MGNQTSKINQVNELIQNAQKTIACDQACQQQKQANELKNKFNAAKDNLSLAEPQYQIAKKNYYTYVSGPKGYSEMLENEMAQKADQTISKFKENILQATNELQRQLDTYDGIRMNYHNLYDLYSQYLKDNNALEKEYKQKTNDVMTNERKTYYEEQQIQGLHQYYVLLWVAYVFVVLLFFVFAMFPSSNTTLGTRFGMGLFFLILPFVSTWLLSMIVYLFYWIYSLLPKNVYL